MTVLAWDPARFDVGVAKMNSEHEVLVGLMNAIHDRATAGARNPIVPDALAASASTASSPRALSLRTPLPAARTATVGAPLAPAPLAHASMTDRPLE